MAEYDDGPRPLPWYLRHPLVANVTVDDDENCSPSSFVWPENPDERTLVPFYLSLNEYNVLGSTIDVGSDIAFGTDALKVVWLWMRNMRCEVPICDLVDACINENPNTIASIVNRLQLNPTFNTYITQTIEQQAPAAQGNIYPPRPTSATPDPLCNAAANVVAELRVLFEAIYDDLETLTPDEVLKALLGVFGWRSGPLYQLIGLLETSSKDAMLGAFDAVSENLKCALVEAELDQDAIKAWIATTYPPPSVLGDALTGGVDSAADDGKYAQWIAVGAVKTGAECDCGAPPDPYCNDLRIDDYTWYAGDSAGNPNSAFGSWEFGLGLVPGAGNTAFFVRGAEPSRPVSEVKITTNIATSQIWLGRVGQGGLVSSDATGTVHTFNNANNPGAFPRDIGFQQWITFPGNVAPGGARIIKFCYTPV